MTDEQAKKMIEQLDHFGERLLKHEKATQRSLRMLKELEEKVHDFGKMFNQSEGKMLQAAVSVNKDLFRRIEELEKRVAEL